MKSHAAQLAYTIVTVLSLLTLVGCGEPKWNSDYNLSQAQQKNSSKTIDSTALASADTTQPDITTSSMLNDVEKKEKKKKKKRSRYFFGEKVKRGFTRTGKGERETLETYSYLPEAAAPYTYAQEKFVLDTRRNKIGKVRGDVEGQRYKLLHGPYKKTYGGVVIEEGYFYKGTKHLRWEKYRRDGALTDKAHYDQGFLRDAVITYYGGNKEKIKEVIPYAFGEVQGTYYRFHENGQLEWSGQYDKGRKVGVWIKYYDFRNRRHYEFQYPKTAYEPQSEPVLIKEYDRHGTLIYEKDKFDKRSAQR